MKLVLLLILAASPVLAQATSQKRIPVGKEKQAEAPGEVVATPAPVVIHDTIVVYKTDSLGVFQSALSSTVPDTPLAEACHSRWIPVPIPIPLEAHDHQAAITTPVQATPEPGTLTLFGTGLFGLTLYVKRPRK